MNREGKGTCQKTKNESQINKSGLMGPVGKKKEEKFQGERGELWQQRCGAGRGE